MINKEIKIFQVDSKNIRLDNYLSSKIESFSRTKIKKLILDGKILVNKAIQKPAFILSGGEEIACDLSLV